MNSKKEKLLKEAYSKLLDVGFGEGSLETINQFIDDDVMGYGTAQDEKIMSIQEFKYLMIDQRKQAVNFDDFSFTSKPVINRISDNGNTAVIVDEIVLLTRIQGEANELAVRMSTVFEFRDKSWKLIYWHGSKPEHISGGDDPWHVDEWQRKNEELQKLVDEKTSELLNKNRELEIETALERVRAIALSMKDPADMLDVCRTISHQLEALHVKDIRNVQTAIINESKGTYINYEYYSKHDKSLTTEVDFKTHELQELFVNQMLEGAEELFARSLKGKEVKDWYEYQKTTNQFADTYLEKAKSLSYYWYSLGPVALGISTYTPLSEEEINLFKRFRNVFELSYRRFIDIEQAVTQAREAKIEAALEKVRSSSLAMKEPGDMVEVCRIISDQLQSLGVNEIRNVQTAIINEQKGTYLNYQYFTAYDKGIVEDTEYNKHPKIFEFVQEMKRSENSTFSGSFEGEELNGFREYRKQDNQFADPLLDEAASMHYYFYSIGFGGLGLSTYKPLNDDALEIFKRFHNVFTLAYRRFIDIEKAMAQAREAQIELALERVRARAMAMQKSGELSELVDTVFKELTKLDFALNWCIINIIDEPSLSNTVWAANPDIDKAPESYHMKFEDYPFHHAMMKGYQERRIKHVYVLEGQEKKIYDEYLFNETEFRRVPAAAQTASRAMEKYVVTFTFSNFGGLQTVGETPLSDDNIDILSRFGKVFDLTYTRFNDLKLAEAQAREAQIEAALERVRSRSMGMQKSEELKEVIRAVYEQFVNLKINVDHAGFVVDYKPKGDWHFWIADEQDIPSKITHPYFESVWANQFNEAKEKGADFFATNLDFEEKNKFYNELLSYVPGLPEASKDFYLSCPGLAGSTVLLENVGLYIENFSGAPYSDEENKILMRFGKVFQQTYTRFLDLQKAEAQAREAEIQLALERVRARTMAMHHSTELGDVAAVLFTQMNQLVTNLWTCGFVLCEKDRDEDEWWLSMNAGFTRGIFLPNVGDYTHAALYKGWLNGDTFLTVQLEGKALQEHYEWLMSIPISRKIFEEMDSAGLERPDWQKLHAAYFSKGYLCIITQVPCPEEEIFKRFAQVFDLTYTRFLDLQKAEAQAREAKIEAALEKVRSRSLAMHKSEELLEVITVVSEQLKHLGFRFDHVSFAINNLMHDYRFWLSFADQPHPYSIFVPYLDNPIPEKVKQAQQKKLSFYADIIKPEDSKQWHKHVFENNNLDFVNEKLKQYIYKSGFARSIVLLPNIMLIVANYASKSYSEEENEVISRFANVFEQSYTRFLDLQKAEAQAREAEIELALERVRARTMAMQQSDELAETAHVLYQQFKELDKLPKMITIGIMDEEKRVIEFWVTDWSGGGSKVNNKFFGSIDEPTLLNKIFTAWKENKKSIFIELAGKDLQAWINYRISLSGVPDENDYSNSHGFVIAAFFSKGILSLSTYESISEDTILLLERFAGVFDGTYTRFLDLQKAEAQAREARIETALEKVRSRTMAMQKSDELAETAAVLFKQLIILGIEPNRIYITIIKDESGVAEFWITDEDGSKVSSGFIASLNDNSSFKKMYEGWKEQKKSITIDMYGEELQEYFRHLTKLNVPFKGGLSQKRRVQNIAYFSKGFIGVASPNPQPEETINLLERFAAVFNLTYTRFNDLMQAEAQNKIIQADNERKTKELEDARELQLSMLPKELPKLPHLDIAVYMKTATEVGGDYYDFNVDKDGTLTFVVGDATGHGMMSGMMVSIMKSFFISHKTNIELKQFFENTNNSIKDMHLGRLMMAFMGVQITSTKIIATNAGMPSLIYFRNKSQKAGEFVSNNMPLGGMKGIKYSLKEINFEKGDTLLLMSDGFAELKNEIDEQYGYPRIIEDFKSVAQKRSNEIVDHLKYSASQWINGVEPDDDVTFVVIKVK